MAKKKSPGKKKQKVKGLNQIENAPKFSKLPEKAEPMASSFSSPASPSASGISISLCLAHNLSAFVSFWCNWVYLNVAGVTNFVLLLIIEEGLFLKE